MLCFGDSDDHLARLQAKAALDASKELFEHVLILDAKTTTERNALAIVRETSHAIARKRVLAKYPHLPRDENEFVSLLLSSLAFRKVYATVFCSEGIDEYVAKLAEPLQGIHDFLVRILHAMRADTLAKSDIVSDADWTDWMDTL
jgi:hypothetical protein